MYAHHDGVKLFYQTTGGSGPELSLPPPSQPVVYSRAWKYQLAYLSRYFRVTVLDPRGNGRSDRPPAGYDLDTRYRDLLAVLDAAVRPPFAVVALACSAMLAFRYAVEHPDRLSHLILVSGQYAESVPGPFDEKVAPVIRNDFDNWLRRLFTRTFQEPHSLKGIEDGMAWTAETTPEVLVESLRAIDGTSVLDLLGRTRVPTPALHGTRDKIVPYSHAQKMVAAIPGARLVTFEGGGHGLAGREQVKVNRLIRDFVLDRPVESGSIPPATERTAPARPGRSSERRVLWVSSPIGLGHIQRDLAIARKLREIHPDVRVDFLTADPADRAVAHWGERLHPAARLLHDVRRRRGARAVRPLGQRRGPGPRLLPAREPGPQAGAVRLPHGLHRHAADARRSGLDRVRSLPGEERRERRPPEGAPRRARSLAPGRRRRGRARPALRARSPQHARVGAGALQLPGLHVALRPGGLPRQGRAPSRARLP